MVPFYGQGMNSGLEDVRVLFSILDKHISAENITSIVNPDLLAHQRALALSEYSWLRTPDAHAINDLALQNYAEMRASVISPIYRLRKFLEESLSVYVPSLRWQTRYSRVSFGNERYSEVIKKSERQKKLLVRGLVGLLAGPIMVGGWVAWSRWRVAFPGMRGLLKW